MKTLGVIGGLGPMATALFLRLITAMTDAGCDQQHIDMVIRSIPSTPDRTAYLLGKSSENPLPPVLAAARKLEQDDVACIAIPCVTMSCFMDELRAQLSVPVIDIVEETAECLRANGIACAGIMATDGTISFGHFQRALEERGIRAVVPTESMQAHVRDIIFSQVKKNLPVDTDSFFAVADSLRGQGAECVVLGCTELSVVNRDFPVGAGFIDALEALAMRCITECGAQLLPGRFELRRN